MLVLSGCCLRAMTPLALAATPGVVPETNTASLFNLSNAVNAQNRTSTGLCVPFFLTPARPCVCVFTSSGLVFTVFLLRLLPVRVCWICSGMSLSGCPWFVADH